MTTTAVPARPAPLRDSATMLRRSLKHIRRYPEMTFMLAGLPVIFLLLFVYVFGGTLGAGLGGAGAGRAEYLTYVLPGVLMMTIGTAGTGAAISIATDMTEGIVARFRTMAIARVSILTGHVVGSLIQTMLAVVIVIGVALAIGYRPDAGPLGWLGIAGVLVLATFGVTWLSVAMGLVARSVETASNLPMPLTLLPFLGSGFVPTDSMPVGLRQFAEYQPFTPIMETLRALLAGTAVGTGTAIAAVAWSLGIALTGYVWAKWRYNRSIC
ncbi:MAG TPA: ABC transporter permease [Actinoplanes sp.]|nr:ABC transporter permease [Actinoplanes sp.]